MFQDRHIPLHAHWSLLAALMLTVIGLLAGCQPGDPSLPTVMSLEQTASPTPEQTAGSTATFTPAPLPTNTPAPTLVPVGRNANDPTRRAEFRVIHAASDTEAIDVGVNGVNITQRLGFGSTSGQTPINAGQYQLSLSLSDSDAPPLLIRDLTIAANDSLLLVLTGTPDARVLTTYREITDPIKSGASRVNFIHAVPRLPDITVTRGEQPMTDPIAFDRESGGLLATVGSTTYTITDGIKPLLALDSVNLRERVHYTFVLIGSAQDPESLQILRFERSVPGVLTARGIHMAQGLPALDLYLGSVPLAQGLSYTQAGARQTINSGSVELRVFEAGADANSDMPLLSGQRVNLRPDDTLTIVVMGTRDSLQALPVVEALGAVAPETARITFVNTLPMHRRVDLFFSDDETSVSALYGQVSSSTISGSAELNVIAQDPSVTDETDGVVEESRFTVDAGRSYLYLISGQMDTAPILFSEPVAVEAILTDLEDSTNSTLPAADFVSEARIVNATYARTPVNVYINDNLQVESLLYGSGSARIPFTGDTLRITVEDAATGALLAAASQQLPTSPGSDPYLVTDYSVYLSGGSGEDLFVTFISDDQLNLVQSNPSIRLVNLTNESRHVFSLYLGSPTAPPADSAVGTPGVAPLRPSVPLGTQRMVTRVLGRTASLVVLAPEAQTRDVIIADEQDRIALRVRSQSFSNNTLYDVIAIERLLAGREEVYALVIPHPPQP